MSAFSITCLHISECTSTIFSHSLLLTRAFSGFLSLIFIYFFYSRRLFSMLSLSVFSVCVHRSLLPGHSPVTPNYLPFLMSPHNSTVLLPSCSTLHSLWTLFFAVLLLSLCQCKCSQPLYVSFSSCLSVCASVHSHCMSTPPPVSLSVQVFTAIVCHLLLMSICLCKCSQPLYVIFSSCLSVCASVHSHCMSSSPHVYLSVQVFTAIVCQLLLMSLCQCKCSQPLYVIFSSCLSVSASVHSHCMSASPHVSLSVQVFTAIVCQLLLMSLCRCKCSQPLYVSFSSCLSVSASVHSYCMSASHVSLSVQVFTAIVCQLLLVCLSLCKCSQPLYVNSSSCLSVCASVHSHCMSTPPLVSLSVQVFTAIVCQLLLLSLCLCKCSQLLYVSFSCLSVSASVHSHCMSTHPPVSLSVQVFTSIVCQLLLLSLCQCKCSQPLYVSSYHTYIPKLPI